MKQKLTLILALVICKLLWIWIRDNTVDEASYVGTHDYKAPYKHKWPRWGEYGRMKEHCPCCEYSKGNCDICPLLSLWPNKCECGNSAYDMWCETDDPKYAQQIIDGCNDKLYEILKGA